MTELPADPSAETLPPADRTKARVLFAIVMVGLVLRIAWFSVPEYSQDDETVYLNYARQIYAEGWTSFGKLVSRYLQDPESWSYPHPLRWGAILLSWTSCELSGECTFQNLSAVSTIAGVACIILTFELARELLGSWPALVAAALTVTSPLQLAMGRRALMDEPFCAFALAFLWFFVRLLRSDRPEGWLTAVAIATGTMAMAVKELFVFFYPGFVLLLLLNLRRRKIRARDVLVLVAPPLLHFAVFGLLSGSPGMYVEVMRRVTSRVAIPFAQQYQGGPPHRLLLDLFLLAPIVCLLAAGAIALIFHRSVESREGIRWIAVSLVSLLLVFAFLPSKNLRYIIVADPLIRVLAAWVLVQYPLGRERWRLPILITVVLFSGLTELAIFHQVFIAGEVYDPVTDELLRALKAIPQ
jgi:4-amino-4-deoxy-L-arabinose transferase-like glycosyltransferase